MALAACPQSEECSSFCDNASHRAGARRLGWGYFFAFRRHGSLPRRRGHRGSATRVLPWPHSRRRRSCCVPSPPSVRPAPGLSGRSRLATPSSSRRCCGRATLTPLGTLPSMADAPVGAGLKWPAPARDSTLLTPSPSLSRRSCIPSRAPSAPRTGPPPSWPRAARLCRARRPDRRIRGVDRQGPH